jgi:hypothetical protein
MTLSAPQTVYGVHSLTLYNRTDWLPYGIMKVLGSLSFDLSGDFNDLNGGSSRYPWDSESGVISAGLTGTIKEIPNFAFEKFLGGTATANSAEAAGNVGTVTNQNGTSVVAATGLASAQALTGSEDDLKDGIYVIKAVGADSVDVYAMSDVDFDKGTDAVFEDNLLKITATPLTIATGGDVTVPNFGFELTGGAGTIALVTGDTAYVYIRKENSGSDLITIGQSTAVFPAFGVKMTSQKKGNGDTFLTQIFNAKAIGLPISLNEADWLNSDITIKALYDSTENAVARFRRIRGE